MPLDIFVCGTLPRGTPEIRFIFRNLFIYVLRSYENPGVDPSRSVGEFNQPRKGFYENGRKGGIYEGRYMSIFVYRKRCHILEDTGTDQRKDFIMKQNASGYLTRDNIGHIIPAYFNFLLWSKKLDRS